MLKKHYWWVLAALLALHIIAHIDRSMLTAFAPQVMVDLSLSNTQFGFLSGAVWVFSYAGLALVLGSMADRHSRPRIIAWGLLVWSVCTFASGCVESFGQMALARFFIAAGEAALVPAASALLIDIFPDNKRGGAIGIFFMGIPLGLGAAFLIAGTLGVNWGWRGSFITLGVIGILCALPLFTLKDIPNRIIATKSDKAFVPINQLIQALRHSPATFYGILGFVMLHFIFAALSFTQLWLVNERGLDPSTIARKIGIIQIIFGSLGALAGGLIIDFAAKRFKGEIATVLALMVLCAMPFIFLHRLVAPDSPFLYVGLALSIFLVLGTYGGALKLIQNGVPTTLRSSTVGFTIMMNNLIAIALGHLGVGWAVDKLNAQGVTEPLTKVLLGVDAITACAFIFFLLAAIYTKTTPSQQKDDFVMSH